MGETAIRFRRVTSLMVRGVKSLDMIVLFYVEMAIYTLFVRTFCRCNEAGSTPQLTANYKMRRTDIKRKGRRFVRCCRVKSAPCLPGDMMK